MCVVHTSIMLTLATSIASLATMDSHTRYFPIGREIMFKYSQLEAPKELAQDILSLAWKVSNFSIILEI